MLATFIKRVLPFVLTLIFGIGLGSIFGSSTRTTQVVPRYTPSHTYKGCGAYKRRNVNSSTSSQSSETNTTTPRSEPVLTER